MLKNFITLLFTILISTNSNAGHLLGGEFTYKCIDRDRYEFNLTLYRSCLCQPGTENCALFDSPAVFTIFRGNEFLSNLLVEVDPNNNSELVCSNNEPAICIEKSVGYKTTFPWGSRSESQTITYMRCCRSPNTLNIENVEESGITFAISIPPNDLADCNNSPVFNTPPPIYIKANENFEYDHSATDEDGDSLVYRLCTPFDYPLDPTPVDQGGNGPSINSSSRAPTPPYNFTNWKAPMSEENPLGTQSTISIDANTGLLRVNAKKIGQFMVAICVAEYRNGNLLGTIMREFQYNIIDRQLENSTCDCTEDKKNIWCFDFDNNGLGSPDVTIKSCEQPQNFVADCSDVNFNVNINEHNENLFSIYPNPTNGHFKIETNGLLLKHALISLYNTSGKLIMKPKALILNQFWSTPNDLPNGLYYVQMNFKNKIYQEKLLLIK